MTDDKIIKTAEKFWKTRKRYPPFVHNFQRRYLDLGMVLNYIDGINSILDLGCGEGQILLMLRELTDIKNYYGYDISQFFISNLVKRWGDYPGLMTKEINFKVIDKLPEIDMCICMGVMPYIFDDNDLKNLISNIKSKIFICRMPCNLESTRVTIDKFSKDLGDNYAAIYRTIPEYIYMLLEFFNIKSICRCYSDEIESNYSSKQFYFICEKRKNNENKIY